MALLAGPGRPRAKVEPMWRTRGELAETWEQSDYGYFLDDEYPDEFLEEHAWDDSEAGYFQQTADDPHDEADEEPYFDIQEFDEAYATYVDARRRFQDLVVSCRWWPCRMLQLGPKLNLINDHIAS